MLWFLQIKELKLCHFIGLIKPLPSLLPISLHPLLPMLPPLLLLSFLSQICLLSCYKYDFEDLIEFREKSSSISCLEIAQFLGSILVYRCSLNWSHPSCSVLFGVWELFSTEWPAQESYRMWESASPCLSWQRRERGGKKSHGCCLLVARILSRN